MQPARKRICLSGIILSLMISLPTLGAAQPDPLQIEWFQVSTDSVDDVDWSLDGQYIATGNATENELRVFDWENENYIWSYTFEPSSDSRYFPEFLVRWSPDGRYIASISGGKVYIIDFQSRSLMRMIDVSLISRDDLSDTTPYAGHMDWSSDSGRLAILNSDGYIDIVSVESGSILQTIDIVRDPNMRGEGIFYTIFDWSPDSLWLAAPYYIPNMPLTSTMGFWDENGQFIEAFATTNESPDKPLCPVYGLFNHQILAVEWANDSRTLAVGGSYGYGVCVLTVDGTIENQQISHNPPISLAWSPDQRWLANISGTCFRVTIRESVAGAVVSESTIPASDSCINFSIRWSPDSRYIAVATNRGLWVGRVTEPRLD